VRRLTILLAAVGALLLIPVAQAFANGPGVVTVIVEGGGAGEVSSAAGLGFIAPEYEGLYSGSPPIQCNLPSQEGDVCETQVPEEAFEPGLGYIGLTASPAPGSEFVEWEFLEGDKLFAEGYCGTSPNCVATTDGFTPANNITVVAYFEAEKPSGPTNLRTLTLKKSAGGSGGTGAVSSKPKGINCGTGCDEAVASMFENSVVVLKAKASTGSSIASWTGCETSTGVGGAEGTCTVTMSEAHEVEIAWSGTSKAITNPTPLTLSKGESSGKGTVKAAGLSCEAECTATTVLYQGPTTKPGKLVTLKEVAAFGSEFSGWTGCDSEAEGNCLVTMEAAREVVAEFTLKPTTTLTVNKAGTGSGTVSSKPKAINCGATCTTQDATVPTNEAVILKEKPGLGMTFEGWTGACEGSGETCTVSLSSAGTVTAKFGGTAKAIVNPQELTLTKAGSGYGTVKAAGMACEALCASTVSLYQGPTTKPGKLVKLKAVSAPGSKAVVWGGCDEVTEAGECLVTMEAAEEVTATFDELE